MKKITVKIKRFDPETEKGAHFQPFTVSVTDQSTILEILMRIYDEQDSSLAFDHGCRVKNCGLCAVTVNDRPRFACVTPITDDTTIGPLGNLPIIKDLVIDRGPFFSYLQQFDPFIIRKTEPIEEPETILQPEEHAQLMSCRECFSCLATCSQYDYRERTFGGPLGFVKLAQLHYDVRDSADRVSQAQKMGIARCVQCKGCKCIAGIPIKKLAIQPFLEQSGVKNAVNGKR